MNSFFSGIARALTLAGLSILLSVKALAQENFPSITIVIDDLGNNLALGKRALALPGPVTYAVLPFSLYSTALAKQAQTDHKEIMLHMPMGNENNKPLGPGGLTQQLSQQNFSQRLQAALDSLAGIKGVNNHMGSRLTSDTTRMNWVMDELQKRPLFFLDSRTTARTVAANVAIEHDIPTLSRDVFLDNNPSPAAIHTQFLKLIEIARENGSAVAIGHPYPTTLGYLETVLPQLDSLGIQLVSPSGLLAIRNNKEQTEPRTFIASHSNSNGCSQEEELTLTRFKCGT